ncbi:hypothetical protein Salat_2131400 [Sesamum alatum]|uniref:Uncharacterized protein n=1 Tax=Sesamum alatum TaxID=300844 RepID=A0AAE1Y142_9LAMI|nr:hypothetical protein Salat_2131400 [Sesamum alatum]
METASLRSLQDKEDSMAPTISHHTSTKTADGYGYEDDEQKNNLDFEDVEVSDEQESGYSSGRDDEMPSQAKKIFSMENFLWMMKFSLIESLKEETVPWSNFLIYRTRKELQGPVIK